MHSPHYRINHSWRVDSIVLGKLRRFAGWAPVRFLRIVSENDDRTEERSQAVEKPEDGVKVFGEGEGTKIDLYKLNGLTAVRQVCCKFLRDAVASWSLGSPGVTKEARGIGYKYCFCRT